MNNERSVAHAVANGSTILRRGATCSLPTFISPVGPSPDDHHYDTIAVFPLGFPFLAGPGTIVTTILLFQRGGSLVTAFAALLVYLSVIPLLHLAPLVERAIGSVGVLIVTRILCIFICAKAVSFVIAGIQASS